MKRDLIIREVDDAILEASGRLAAVSGGTIEDEARVILKSHLSGSCADPSRGLGARIHQRFVVAGKLVDRVPDTRTELPRFALPHSTWASTTRRGLSVSVPRSLV